MTNKKLIFTALFVIAAIIVLILLMPKTEQAETTNAEMNINTFPLVEGAYWIYKGQVLWMKLGDTTGIVNKDTLTWKMEVMEVVNRGNVTGALMKGHPDDLNWYDKGRERIFYVIIKVGSKYYYANLNKWKRLIDEDDNLIDLVKVSNLFLDLPLWKGKNYGEDVQLTRPDSSYCWFVTEEKDVFYKEIEGVEADVKRKQFSIMYRTNPEHEIIEFTPDIGITRYIYQHHGSISDVDVKLIEYYVPY